MTISCWKIQQFFFFKKAIFPRETIKTKLKQNNNKEREREGELKEQKSHIPVKVKPCRKRK